MGFALPDTKTRTREAMSFGRNRHAYAIIVSAHTRFPSDTCHPLESARRNPAVGRAGLRGARAVPAGRPARRRPNGGQLLRLALSQALLVRRPASEDARERA